MPEIHLCITHRNNPPHSPFLAFPFLATGAIGINTMYIPSVQKGYMSPNRRDICPLRYRVQKGYMYRVPLYAGYLYKGGICLPPKKHLFHICLPPIKQAFVFRVYTGYLYRVQKGYMSPISHRHRYPSVSIPWVPNRLSKVEHFYS